MTSNPLQPVIDLVFNGQTVQTYPFTRETLSIGRMRENDIIIDNLLVSRFHAKIHKKGDQILIEDQGSENGCFVNGKKISETVEISEKDEVIIGKHKLVLKFPKAPTVNLPKMPNIAVEAQPAAGSAKAPSTAWDASSTFVADKDTQEKIIKRIAEKLETSKKAAEATEQPGAKEAELNRTVVAPAKEKSPDVALIVAIPGHKEEIYYWTNSQMTIGRAMDCEIILDQPQVSRNHAILSLQDGCYFIEDLDTGNGTYVNQVRIKKKELFNNDTILVGNNQIIFKAPTVKREEVKAEGATTDFQDEAATPEEKETASAAILPETEEGSLDDLLQGDEVTVETSKTATKEISGKLVDLDLTPPPIAEDSNVSSTDSEPAFEDFESSSQISKSETVEPDAPNQEGILNESQTAGLTMFSSEDLENESPIETAAAADFALSLELDLSRLPDDTKEALKKLLGKNGTLPISLQLKLKTKS